MTDDNAVSIGMRLKNITSDQTFLNKHDVVLTLDILEKVVNAQNTSELVRRYNDIETFVLTNIE